MPFQTLSKDEFLKTEIVNVSSYGAIGDGIKSDSLAISQAISDANDNEVLLPSGTYKIDNNITIPSNVSIRLNNGAKFSIDEGVTVTINGHLGAGLYQIFDGDGTVSIAKGSCEYLLPQWWGAVGDGVADDTTAFTNAATASVDKILFVPSGTYRVGDVNIGATVEIWFSNGVTLSVDNTKTLTISGRLLSPYVPTNSGSGTFIYSSASRPPYISYGEITFNNVIADSTPNSDHTITGATIFPMTAAGNVAFGDICYINASGKCAIANASTEATCRVVFICADASIAQDAVGNFALIASGGVIRDDSWDWSTVGAKVYLSTSGTSGNTWTDTAPSGSGNGIIIVGITLSDDEVLVSHFVIVEHI